MDKLIFHLSLTHLSPSDLALAGEFGTELLQSNEELRGQLERQRQEAGRRIEGLEQERSHLRRQLEDAEDMWQVELALLEQLEQVCLDYALTALSSCESQGIFAVPAFCP